ncbi:MAG: hypothetical protein HY842_09710 [Bacteroidetes bacterium]|nr:hypothetical protein [Bacteroidota bacterium]
MTNSYKKHLDHFFEKLLYYRHISGRINKVVQKDVKVYSDEGAIIHFISALVISDWTGPTDKGWEMNFHTGIVTETTKDNYESEMRKIYSRQLCLLYAQSFEAFERFVKDCLFNRIGRDDAVREYTISLLPKNQQSSITREKMPGGGNLFKVLKKAGGETFKNFTSKNNLNIKFSELWTILSEVRHSITHKESLIESGLIKKTKHHTEIFKFLFNSKDVPTDLLSIELDFEKFERLIKRFSEFAYQIFKILSIEEKLEWENYN